MNNETEAKTMNGEIDRLAEIYFTSNKASDVLEAYGELERLVKDPRELLDYYEELMGGSLLHSIHKY